MPENKDGKYRWFSIDSCWVDIVIFVPYMQRLLNQSEEDVICQWHEAVRRGERCSDAVCVTRTGTVMINMSPR